MLCREAIGGWGDQDEIAMDRGTLAAQALDGLAGTCHFPCASLRRYGSDEPETTGAMCGIDEVERASLRRAVQFKTMCWQ